MTDDQQQLYRLRSVIDNFVHEGAVIDRLLVTWFVWDVNERQGLDLAAQASWVAPGYVDQEPDHPDFYAAELTAACFTAAEADELEDFLRRTGRLRYVNEAGERLERIPVSLPLPWFDDRGPYQPIGRLPNATYGEVFGAEDYDLDWRVAFYADVRDGIDRATGEPVLRLWRPGDGEIVG